MSRLPILGFAGILSAVILSGCTSSETTSTPVTETISTLMEGEFCVDKETDSRLSYQEAVEIAQDSDCVEQGQLKETGFCNENSGTWWIDLDIDKPGCNPACVVNVSDRTAEINWRCTGAIEPIPTP